MVLKSYPPCFICNCTSSIWLMSAHRHVSNPSWSTRHLHGLHLIACSINLLHDHNVIHTKPQFSEKNMVYGIINTELCSTKSYPPTFSSHRPASPRCQCFICNCTSSIWLTSVYHHVPDSSWSTWHQHGPHWFDKYPIQLRSMTTMLSTQSHNVQKKIVYDMMNTKLCFI